MSSSALKYLGIAAWLAATACSGSPGTVEVDLATAPDLSLAIPAPMDLSTAVAMIPGWMLEDVQPVSPRTGQTYGLEGFAGKTRVVTLVEGF